MFVHAILGCDTTFRVHGIGKGIALKKVKSNAQFRELASVFNRENALKDEIVAAGENALLQLHNAGFSESLDSLCYSRFCQRVASGKASLQPENLRKIDKCSVYEKWLSKMAKRPLYDLLPRNSEVHNFTSLKLTERQSRVLGLGLKFRPLLQPPSEAQFDSQI